MITNIQLTHDQILALLADVAGVKPGDLDLCVSGADDEALVSVTIATDFKGAQRVQRRLDRVAK